jgi:DNA-binding MarR family transcriptional regulator
MRAERYSEYSQDSAFKVGDSIKLGGKEQIIIMEIGYEHIDSASAFVDYIYEEYGFSKSTVWYNLKKLKKKGVVSFAEKGESQKPLELTKEGIVLMRGLALRSAKRIYEVAVSSPA